MKIGLITYCDKFGDNYGQILQGFATSEFLKQLGHDVALLQVPYEIDRSIIARTKNKINKILRRGVQNNEFNKWYETVLVEAKRHPRNFKKFIEKNINYREGTCQDFLSDNYDAYVAGSDQIWSWPNKLYMLGWVPNNKPKISIASSVGSCLFNYRKKIHAWTYLRHFDLITVREENGVELCNSIGIKHAKCVLDPVFLHNMNYYANYEDQTSKTEPYILLYLLSAPVEVDTKQILEFAENKGLKVRYVESQGRIDGNIKDKEYPTIGEWLNLIRDASYVITNSFHGTAFSIIYRKKFLALPLIGVHSNMNIRLNSLLAKMGLMDRLYKHSLESVDDNIDWTETEHVINNNKSQLSSMINNALSINQ